MEAFSGEEGSGRFLDLGFVHQVFLNLPKLRDHKLKEYVQAQWSKYVKNHPEYIDFSREVYEDFTRQKSLSYRPLDYVSWLRQFTDFSTIPRHLKYRQNEYVVCNNVSFMPKLS